MLRNTLCLTLLITLASSVFAALPLRTERNALCGVELYEERYDGEVCGWVYYEKQTNACELDYYLSGADMSCAGSDNGGWSVQGFLKGVTSPQTISWGNGNKIQGGEDITKLAFAKSIETTYWSCSHTGGVSTSGSVPQYNGTITCRAKPYATTCPLQKFGSVYKYCRAKSHGNESPKKCRSDKFSAELYNSCSFYKTREELGAYISETASSLETYAQILPMRQADLYSRTRDEASFKCLIDKYIDMPFMEEVVVDLQDKFFIIFGFKFEESEVDCSSTTINTNPEIRAGSLNCANFTYDSLKSFPQPEGMSKGLFDSFVKKCNAKIVYDNVSSWFDTKKEDVSILENDLAAKNDEELRAKLLQLKSELDGVSK